MIPSFSQAVQFLNQEKREEALKAFQELAKEGGGYGKLAQLYAASLLPNSDVLYTEISKQNAADPALSKLPKILIAARNLDKQDILASLEPLTAPNNAWAPLSLELLALAELKRGDSVNAAKLYIKMLKESSLTPDEKLRASLMLAQLEVPSSLWEEEKNHGTRP